MELIAGNVKKRSKIVKLLQSPRKTHISHNFPLEMLWVFFSFFQKGFWKFFFNESGWEWLHNTEWMKHCLAMVSINNIYDNNAREMILKWYIVRTHIDVTIFRGAKRGKDRNGRTMSVFNFSFERCPIATFWVERCPFSIFFYFTRHCSILFDLLDFVRLYPTLFDFVQLCSTLPSIVQFFQLYRESFDCFCQIICQKPQPGQPQIIKENATKMSIVD